MQRIKNLQTLLPAFLIVVSLSWGIAHGETPVFKRGDANADATVDLSDAAFTLSYLFTGGPSGPCRDAMDTNDDGSLDIADPISTLLFLFLGSSEPRAPGLRCGPDPTPDIIDCASFSPCGFAGNQEQLLSPLLMQADDCDSVLDELRQKLAENMEQVLEENLQMALEFTKGWRCMLWEGVWLGFDAVIVAGGQQPPPRGGGDQTDGAESASEYSDTNNQVEGVDEADFIKNDGAYIYILADNQFQIIDAWPAPDAHTIATVDMEGTPNKLFVHEDRAVVFSSLGLIQQDPGGPWVDWNPGPRYGECTYGYDCEFTGDGRKLRITVFDISDRSQPTVLREIEFSGSYLNARRIGQTVYTVIIFPEVIIPELVYWPEELQNQWDLCWVDPFPFTEDDIRAMFAELKDRNLAIIEEASLVDLIPSITDTFYNGDSSVVVEKLLADCTDFFIPPSGDGQSFLSVASFELAGTGDVEASTIISKPGAVYASQESLYIATRHYGHKFDRWYFDSRETTPEATTLHKFTLFYDHPGTEYVGSGAVKGRILNQFSMDEYEDHLRIATTTGRVPSPTVHSTVSVLEEQENSLELVGQVDNIAPTEDIRSVRFHQGSGYLVTFKKTDPLFVLDLSIPTDPIIRGELKIPGFSTYMHMIDDGHILSIGYDAEDHGNFALFQGILLQIFDVADMENPALLHREVIGTRGSTSDATTNHLAFNYFRNRELLAFPMVICGDAVGGRDFGDRMTFSGLLVYRVGLGGGFEPLGGVPHELPEGGEGPNINCNTWWTRSNSQVKRSIFMDDFVYSVALDQINISHLDDLEHPVSSVDLEK